MMYILVFTSIAIHWLILFSVSEFPDQASITELVENETIKNLARSSIVYSACSSFTALSGNTDLHLSDEEDDKEGCEPIEHLLKVIQATVISFYIVTSYFWPRLHTNPILLGIIVWPRLA